MSKPQLPITALRAVAVAATPMATGGCRRLFALPENTLCTQPVKTRFGVHVIRSGRRAEGRQLPFEAVQEAIAVLEGDEVVVKVQRPGIEKTMRSDLDLLYLAAQVLEASIDEMQLAGVVSIVEEFEKGLLGELDFNRELSNLLEFQRHLDPERKVTVPRPHPELSTRTVLTMQFSPSGATIRLDRSVGAPVGTQMASRPSAAMAVRISDASGSSPSGARKCTSAPARAAITAWFSPLPPACSA